MVAGKQLRIVYADFGHAHVVATPSRQVVPTQFTRLLRTANNHSIIMSGSPTITEIREALTKTHTALARWTFVDSKQNAGLRHASRITANWPRALHSSDADWLFLCDRSILAIGEGPGRWTIQVVDNWPQPGTFGLAVVLSNDERELELSEIERRARAAVAAAALDEMERRATAADAAAKQP